MAEELVSAASARIAVSVEHRHDLVPGTGRALPDHYMDTDGKRE